MDIFRYVPRKIAHSWVLKKKEKSGLNRARARRLDERHARIAEIEPIRSELENALGENVNLTHENGGLKDAAIELQGELVETREKLTEAENDYKKINDAKNEFVKAARRVKHANRDYLATILTGSSHRLKPEDFEKYGINEGFLRIAQDARSELNSLMEQHIALKKDSLAGIVEAVCIANDSERLPLFVYHDGKMTYTSPRFSKMTEKGRYLTSELDDNPKIKERVDAGKKTTMEYAEGEVYFVPEKLKNGEVISIGHYVPAGDGRVSKTYAKHSGAAVKAIYKTLEVFNKLGVEFVKHGKE